MQFGDAGGRRRAALFVAVLGLACALFAPAVARAESFEVNSVADEHDANPGDEFCKTAAETCTLRAALEESNALGGADLVDFQEEGLFDGGIGGTIALTEALPTIAGEIEIYGECVPPEEVLRPCVGVDGPGPTEAAFSVENGFGVTLSGLAITGAEVGIEAMATTRFKSLGNWLGVKLDRSAGGNGTGILVGKGAARSLIGNGGTPNVFAHNAAVGLDLFGATATEVLGDYFGVAPDGVTAAANGKDIEVSGDSLGGFEASGTLIGTPLSKAALATPECDGGCNVIAGAATSGIDLEGDGAPEVPATATSIVGNFFGLAAGGTVPVANGGDSIEVGAASRTLVGGPRLNEANLFAGGASAVRAGPGAANLVVRGNAIGVDALGNDSAPSDDGILVSSEGLLGPLEEAQISGNELRMQGGVAIEQRGLGAWIAANAISGAAVGVATAASNELHGNLIEGNLIEASELNAVLLENDGNEVLGNEIAGSGGAGIRIHSTELPFGVSGNRVGGDLAWQENAISDAGGAAIEIANAEKSENEIARNRGAGNGGFFIDLVSLDPLTEPKGPNSGLKPPTIQVLTATRVAGIAEPEAVIRLFRKAGPSPGEVESFIAAVVADEDGFWELEPAAPLPAATFFAASQSSESRRTSELAIKATPPPAAPKAPGGGAKSCANCVPPFVAGPAPNTKLLARPPKKSHERTAVFKFRANQGNVTFRCRLDGKSWGKCRSPKKYRHLKPGKHTFRVRAVGATGMVDGSPARYSFRVLR